MKKVFSPKYIIRLSLFLFIGYCILLPVLSIFSRINAEGIVSVFKSPLFAKAAFESIYTSLIGSFISLVLGFIAAYIIQRVDIKLKGLFSFLFFIPMLIPSISHAFGLVALFGRNGFFTKALNLSFSIYGRQGIIAGSVMYSFPVSFLMLSNVMKYEDYSPHEAALVMGISPFRRFTGITFPYIKKAIISTFFAVFTMIITDYGVPLMIGGKVITLSVMMYNKAVALLDYSQGSVIGAILILPAILAFLIDILNPANQSQNFVNRSFECDKKKSSVVVSYVFCAIIAFLIVLPTISFITMAFANKYPTDNSFSIRHIVRSIDRGALGFLFNSVFIATVAGALGTIIAFISAYTTARSDAKVSKVLHLLILISMAIPGIVLGLSYVIFFNRSAIYGTFIILCLVNIVHFISSPYLMMYNTLGKVNKNLEDVGLILGVSKLRVIKDCILPKVFPTIIEIFSYYFINCMMTISAVSFLVPPAPKPISLMINQFEAQLLMECAAFVSILILLVNLLAKLICDNFSKKRAI